MEHVLEINLLVIFALKKMFQSVSFLTEGEWAYEQRNVPAVAVAEQHFRLVDHMTIAEAITVSPPVRRSGWIPSPAVEETGSETRRNQVKGLDDIEQRCWHAFLESSTVLLETLDRRLMKAHDLTLFDFLVLSILARSQGGSARMGDLAEALAVGPSRMTQQIRRLESQGLVRRTRSMKDKRGVVATVTREGRMRLQPANRTYGEHIRKHYLDRMSRQQMIAMGDSCRRINLPLNNSRISDRFSTS